MTKKITIRTLILAVVAVFGFAASSSAQSTGVGQGLLGQSYVGLDYGYTDLHRSPIADLQGLNFQYNQPLNTGFDLNIGLSNSWSSQFLGTRECQKTVDASTIAFIPDLTWGRPFIGVGAGWTWTKMSGDRENSFLYKIDTGVEFQVTRALSITPVVSFTDTTSLHTENRWAYGVKANYWITRQWGLTAGVMRDNRVNTTYSLGTNYRF
jgi:hypothetical protein